MSELTGAMVYCVYLTSIGAISAPVCRPKAEKRPSVVTPGYAEGRGPMVSAKGSRPELSSRLNSYQYPPSSFPSCVTTSKEHAEPKLKSRVRPTSLQLLSVKQAQQSNRLRKDSDREVKTRRKLSDGEYVPEAGVGMAAHSRTQSMGFGICGNSVPNTEGSVCASVRRASVDVVPAHSGPAYGRVYTTSPESSPGISPGALPSIPSSPVSPMLSPLPSLPFPSQRLFRLQGALTDVDRQVLAREKKRILKGKEKARKAAGGDKERGEVQCEVEAAVRAVCGVFTAEAGNFKPYEAFCAGHVEAMETTRRVMRAHANGWLEWEKRCAEEVVRRDTDGTAGSDFVADSPAPSPSSPKAITHCTSRNSLLSSMVLDAEDSHSSTSTLRRRHSASESSGSLRASASTTLKHTKSDPTPPPAGHSYSQVHGQSQSRGSGTIYDTLSVRRLSRGAEGLYGGSAPAAQNENERQRARSARTKLSFADYLIKPVQRVCKYPLLFEQLRASGKGEEVESMPTPTTASAIETSALFATVTTSVSTSRDPDPSVEPSQKRTSFRLGGDSDDDDEEGNDVDLEANERDTEVAVARVLREMREVARSVDEAKRRRDLEKKSALIVDRLVSGTPGNGNHSSQPSSIIDRDALDDDKGSAEDGRIESRSELGHGTGSSMAGADGAWSSKPPTRSLSFSASFARTRSRSGFGRTNSAFISHLRKQSQATEFGENAKHAQVPGPPTRVFLASLGACLLAGSLDVVVTSIERPSVKPVRRDGGKRDSMLSLSGMTAMGSNNGIATASTYMPLASRDPVKVKYLAAFLYVGGYIVLAKTPKAGVYEPRHWFALTDETIEIVDVREEKALLPCSFHLVFHATGHRLELAAACQREKEIWLGAMHHARSLPPNWIFEPVPTLNVSANLLNPQATRNSVEAPPVPSIPSMGEDALANETNPSRMPSNSTLKADITIKPNRRQSVNGSSVRAFFMSSSDNGLAPPPAVLIRRVSATRRAQTDRHLADVLSQPLLSARFHAKAHDEILFRDPVPPQQGTGIGVGAMAKNKLMARESVLVSKQCAPSICSSLASSVDQSSVISDSASNVTVQGQTQQATRGKNMKKNTSRGSLGMLLTLPSQLLEGNTKDSGMSTPSSQGCFSFDSPLPSTSTATSIEPVSRSQCSSVSPGIPIASPSNDGFPPEVRVVGVDTDPQAEDEVLPDVLDHMERPKRSRSLVNSFRVFFGTPRSLSSSPAPSTSSSRQTSVEGSLEVPDAESTPQRNTRKIRKP
ncbi:uncharacterized protein FOMMEDRAFT_148069 [Fomitiporia mediterranea MF3/22]|uniref:uncharacterized protein n=1 Tax=Fomitiporia mediterranea (strain MF3/22) TaxID=694068 RepID=UPI00044078DF|nr:uncharacterized protein FOMMEDRAFT_148069 [Fomitiporia mediterranea MF3/22]EJD01621.1 hypothetical protein FOMMEDRAFT_148069 [Fomitiporia mediterranea MF3/22]